MHAEPTSLRIGLSARIYHPQAGATGISRNRCSTWAVRCALGHVARGDGVHGDPVGERRRIRHLQQHPPVDYPQYLDGLILQGGADVSPQCYGEEPLHPTGPATACATPTRWNCCTSSWKPARPVLGICRGAQLINVALGGTLFRDIATQVETAGPHVHADYDRHSHAIEWAADSGFASSTRA